MLQLRQQSQKNKRWAQCMLGDRYSQGVGVPQDVKRAFVLWKLAADQGDHGAQHNLGNMYAQGKGHHTILSRLGQHVLDLKN